MKKDTGNEDEDLMWDEKEDGNKGHEDGFDDDFLDELDEEFE